MYIKKLQNWTQKDWDLFFKQYPKICKDSQKEIKNILTLEKKEDIEKHFFILEAHGIINGIGPWWLGRFFRRINTFLFKWVRYEWHDIMYAIWGAEEDRKKADYGLWKYSLECVYNSFLEIWKLQIGNIELIILSIIYILFVPFRVLIAGFCYIMVRIFGKYGAFRFIKT